MSHICPVLSTSASATLVQSITIVHLADFENLPPVLPAFLLCPIPVHSLPRSHRDLLKRNLTTPLLNACLSMTPSCS